MSMTSTIQIIDLLAAIGSSQVIAVTLSNSELLDIHIKGITSILMNSKRIMHFDIS